MDDREIIKLYNCRSEDALLETEKKYGKLVSFIIGRLIKNQLDVEECTNDTYLGESLYFKNCKESGAKKV